MVLPYGFRTVLFLPLDCLENTFLPIASKRTYERHYAEDIKSGYEL